MNCSCEEAAQFSFMVSGIGLFGQNLMPNALGQPCTPWDSGPPQLGTKKATLLSGTQLMPSG